MASQQAYDSPVTKALRRTITRMHESLSTSPRSPVGMDKGDPDGAPESRISSPSDYDAKGHTGLEHPARR
jgi:hypothetical protein